MKFFLMGFLLWNIYAPVSADVSEKQAQEVEYLLIFITKSTCVIDRNGSEHTGAEAAIHIQKKYDYFRDDIKTTEDFIRYSAAKSTLTGSEYSVKCPDKKPETTQQWLLKALQRFRSHTENN